MNRVLTNIKNFKFEYYVNDLLARNSIGNNKEWEPHITKFVKLYNDNFQNIENVIDVGANFGYHSIIFSEIIKGNVYAFEPQIQNFILLQKNIEHNNIKNILAFNNACGDEICRIKMPFIPEINYSINMGDFTPNHTSIYNYTECESILLDNMDLPKIDFIKIDVQGWEKKVLLGCHNILQKDKPILIVEFEKFQLEKTNTSCEELFNFIRNNNYYIFYLEFEYPSDHICIHNSKLDDFRIKFKNNIFSHDEDNNINNNILYNINEKFVV